MTQGGPPSEKLAMPAGPLPNESAKWVATVSVGALAGVGYGRLTEDERITFAAVVLGDAGPLGRSGGECAGDQRSRGDTIETLRVEIRGPQPRNRSCEHDRCSKIRCCDHAWHHCRFALVCCPGDKISPECLSLRQNTVE